MKKKFSFSRHFKWHYLIKFYIISMQLLPKLKWKVRNGNYWRHGCNYNISNNCYWWNALQFLSRRRGIVGINCCWWANSSKCFESIIVFEATYIKLSDRNGCQDTKYLDSGCCTSNSSSK